MRAFLLVLLVLGAGVGGCTFEENTDYAGNDLKPGGDVVQVNTPAECCAACAKTEGCSVWTTHTNGGNPLSCCERLDPSSLLPGLLF